MIAWEDMHALVRFRSPSLPSLNELSSAKERVLARWPDVFPDPPEQDRERLVMEMRDRLTRRDWDGAFLSLVAAAARAAFDVERRERKDLADLRTFYADEIRASKSRTFLASMASVHVGSYVPGAAHTKLLASALREARDRIGGAWHQLFERVPATLDPVAAPGAVAELMLSMMDPFHELKTLGLRSPHAPGLMDHAHLAYVALLERELGQRAGIERLFGWLKPEGQSARVTGAAEAINAILRPWRKGTPPAEDLSHITQSLIGYYGDPRVQRGGAWSGVDADCLAVILRWLTGENIRFFLDVISAVDTGHMYQPRRKFWLKMYEEGRIDAAWVAFGRDAADHARRVMSNKGNNTTLRFGLQRSRSKINTSIIIMQIGNKIVVEGSENHYVLVFKGGHPNPPALYQRYYNSIDIRDTPGVFQRAHTQGWQDWVQRTV